MVELLVAVNIVLMILSDLSAKTIYGCFLSAGRAIFTIAFLVFALGDGIFNVSIQGFTLMVNLTTVYGIVALLSLLGLARSVMQAINFMSERAESGLKP
jgi:cytochrome c oxidase assembly factor CtaG